MKKLLVFMFAAMGVQTAALAQWNTNATPVCIYSTAEYNGDYQATSVKAVRTPDKKTWIAWKTWGSMDIRGIRRDAVRTFLQLLDRDGVPQFEEPIMVNDHMTNSWWSEYRLALAADGSAIVTVADSRHEEATIGDSYTYDYTYYDTETGDSITEQRTEDYTHGQGFQPAIYKIDQEGNFLWGFDGIAFPDYLDSPFTDAYVVGEDTYFIFNGNSNGESDGLNIIRINDDGTLGWEKPVKWEGLKAQIIPSTDGEFLLFDDCPDGARVTRLDRNMESVWGESVIYDPNKYDGMALNQYKIASDGEGGAAVAFVRNVGNFTHNIRVQHIYADGSLGFGLEGLDAANTEEGDFDYCGLCVNPSTQEILVDFESSENDGYHVKLQKFSYDGDYLFDELGLSLAKKSRDAVWQWGRVGAGTVGESDWMVCYRDVSAYAKESFIMRKYDKDGNRIWSRTIGRELNPTSINFFVEPEAAYLIYREYKDDKDPGIKIFRISPAGNYNVTYPEPVQGDVNGDNTIDVADIASVITVMSGSVAGGSAAVTRADVNGDGTVDVADIATVITLMAGGTTEK